MLLRFWVARTPFAVREQWARDWKTGNVQDLRTLYTKDALFMPAAGRLLDGPRDALDDG
jgi:ketosteroid isomerase-like protein